MVIVFIHNNLFIHAYTCKKWRHVGLQNPKNPSRLNIALATPWTLFRGVWQVSMPLTASVHWGEASSSDTASQASIDLKGDGVISKAPMLKKYFWSYWDGNCLTWNGSFSFSFVTANHCLCVHQEPFWGFWNFLVTKLPKITVHQVDLTFPTEMFTSWSRSILLASWQTEWCRSRFYGWIENLQKHISRMSSTNASIIV